MKQTYGGGCQCGKVRYEATFELGEVIACNCSRCGRLGSLLAFMPKDSFKLLSGEGAMTEYQFNKHTSIICSVRPAASSRSPEAKGRAAPRWRR